MVFAEIKNQICTNILQFDTEERAKSFGDNIVKLEEGFGIGDTYVNGVWSKPIETIEQRIEEIDKQLSDIDKQGVTRHLENQIEASGTYETIYETTRRLIDIKNELRLERKELSKQIQVTENTTEYPSDFVSEDEEIVVE